MTLMYVVAKEQVLTSSKTYGTYIKTTYEPIIIYYDMFTDVIMMTPVVNITTSISYRT